MLDAKTKKIVKSTAPILAEKGLDITMRMYDIMFTNHPEVKKLFNMANQKPNGQPLTLAKAVHAYAANIDQLETLTDAVELMAHKHVSLGVKPGHYPIVGQSILQAIDEVLSPGKEILNAWGKAFNFLADILIDRETQLYKEMENKDGGWVGYRKFEVFKKEKESEVITSFYLRPVDGQPVATYEPGQYLTIKLDFPGGNPVTRNYSLSDKPNGEYYRISVKRERRPHGQDAADGLVSCYLHDFIELGSIFQLAAPIGNFVLKTPTNRPIVLLSGGVGLTPMISMLNTLAEKYPEQETYFIHGAINSRLHAMRKHVEHVSASNSNIHHYFSYSDPLEEDVANKNYNHCGFMNKEWFESILPNKDCDYYFCGPKPFMQMIYSILTGWNIPTSQIHYEFFGPADEFSC